MMMPIGIERWWFEFFPGDAQHGRHPSHAVGLSARDMARIGYCMMRGGSGQWAYEEFLRLAVEAVSPAGN